MLGVDAPGGITADRHDLQFTRKYYEAMPAEMKNHLTCRIVEALKPLEQGHTIEGLVMGEA